MADKTEGQRQDELADEMEVELHIMERTYLNSGLCLGNLIRVLEVRAQALRKQEQEELAALNAQDERPAEDENAEHRLGLRQLI